MKQLSRIVSTVAIIGILYHLVYVLYPLQTPKEHLNNHLAFVLLLTFLVALKGGVRYRLFALIMLVLSLVTTGYLKLFYWDLENRLGFPIPSDIVIGVLLLLVVFEASRKTMGLTLVIVALVAILYAFIGPFLPRPFYFPRIDSGEIIAALTTSFQGTHGVLLEVSAYYVFLFVVMGGIMQVTGANNFFNGVGLLLGKRMRGGPAMTSVIGSALVATMSGSTAANVVITGTYTIPLMKKVGYKPAEAGAVEASASNAGQLMPPVMGAAAFVMSRITGIPYANIMVIALVPAVFYLISLGMYVQLIAMKRRIDAREALGETVSVKEMLFSSGGFFLPLGVIIWLFLQGYSPMYVAFWAVMVMMGLGLLRRAPLKEWVQGFTSGATAAATIGVGSAICGVIVKVMVMTGLATKLPALVETLSGGNLLVALVFTMLVSIILGMGVPTTPAYIIVAIMAAPVLVRLGLSLAAAHMFVFYYACMSMLTPPVAPAAIVASQIAGASYLKTAIECCKPAVVGFLIPFIFAINPVFLAQPGPLIPAMTALLAALVMLLATQTALVGQYFTPLRSLERFLLVLCAVALFIFSVILRNYFLFGGAILFFIILTLFQLRRWHTRRVQARLA